MPYPLIPSCYLLITQTVSRAVTNVCLCPYRCRANTFTVLIKERAMNEESIRGPRGGSWGGRGINGQITPRHLRRRRALSPTGPGHSEGAWSLGGGVVTLKGRGHSEGVWGVVTRRGCGHSEGAWSLGGGVVTLKGSGHSEGAWSLGGGVVTLKGCGQSEGMVTQRGRGHSEWAWSLGGGVATWKRCGQSEGAWSV
uniref:Uncharacterized protein n=1 Tax=Knipowitschia caucasica TaxID=637954 RepID=A0AAV2KK67_KNICA